MSAEESLSTSTGWVPDDLAGIDAFEVSFQPAVLTHAETGNSATVEAEDIERAFSPIPALKWVAAHEKLRAALAELFEATTSQLVFSIERGLRDKSIVPFGALPTERQPIVRFSAHEAGGGEPSLFAVELIGSESQGGRPFATLTYVPNGRSPSQSLDPFVVAYRSLLGIVGTCGISVVSFAVDLQTGDLIVGGLSSDEISTRFCFVPPDNDGGQFPRGDDGCL